MSGYYYAFDDVDQLALLAVDLFASYESYGGEQPSDYEMAASLRSVSGVWLTRPVESDPDPETGEQEVLQAGIRSKPFVIVLPEPDERLSDYLVTPDGETLA